MLGFRYLKATPTTYLMRFRNGTAVAQGVGISMWYFQPGSVIVQVNVASQDLPFVFEQQTSDFQDVTIQGNMSFRIAHPDALIKQLDFSVDSRGRYQSEDPDTLRDRLVRLTQVEAAEYVRSHSLEQMLVAGADLGGRLKAFLQSAPEPSLLGIEIDSLQILTIKASPEMQAALQAETREATLQKADQAVHQRRKLAIESEQEIRERELHNERVIQEKQREVREAELAADVAIEQGRAELVSRQAENEKTLAAARVETLQKTLTAMKGVDWKTIAASSESTDAKQMIALAFGQLAENARKIGRLDISPDLLKQLTENSD
ncbi:SPFH domain-containing protein [Stieleria varia]|uniref:SPFH domain / Band 7 family protein n=1 Tax=Stieleria varia TaxID=2528005 RepID=A0A5C5ZQ67_9BACT|nr:SPFH domain-containing protein [Stieleria varia]TWT89336.1 SPFH domain / Band 7 family protein [Stieleria varia]